MTFGAQCLLCAAKSPLLACVAQAVLTIPNSNADCERVFSMIKKIQTGNISELASDSIAALLSCKLNQVQVGKDQEKARSEKDSHSKNRGGEKT